ncbi:MAG: rRNA maturation RNase YbeY [Candidatus Staskawiczbacteria bacterium RIFOXYB2_FULL_32_9]|uniref:Endoribonuclease YbeY n=1 Tax=Candidatus Staskawiczbacteria bacterium RIFOXYD1_FULL_32_13 TaxID=1802234 RepID=A0A1G2JM14_9BACT|nr:MAG: putative rRNA maturation factor [Parcubacteria group bacterium GW2011_GWC2_32_10]OGZ78404.1 MAG: rRNA maturation RNase YbeY [Candidatus Staskawiczbacteria bacterium RIFOXYA2_FULL_32_7]OGZ78656.1 MAG: rRNA maturation RNase YbeY [Candidatus Staskawiczbacteria bacterium RIFOXYB1_FULL_32_11]OGZ81551.1 MAG: rRNA maturation RNase YbeY [Candidatus Staskawiczbacteria bacterium RIFOXYB2_FULL_32_9]OGZ86895.1 MAG: rRNA maturation RNase YbeY [Candidatus Staskawiczbacteria bacterium RIFOXYC2_FULL_32
MIDINNTTKSAVDKKLFTGLAKIILKGENKQIDLSVAFISPKEIKKVNKKYRNKNKPTDVLAFERILKISNLAEVVICSEVAKENAKKFGNTFKKELLKVFIHGVLHVCGYDHEKSKREAKIMEEKENFYLSKI